MKYFLLAVAFLVIAIFAIFLVATPAYSQTVQCADRASMVTFLQGEGMEPRVVGIAPVPSGNNPVAEFWMNEPEGRWAQTLSFPSGRTCLILIGTDLVILPQGEPT